MIRLALLLFSCHPTGASSCRQLQPTSASSRGPFNGNELTVRKFAFIIEPVMTLDRPHCQYGRCQYGGPSVEWNLSAFVAGIAVQHQALCLAILACQKLISIGSLIIGSSVRFSLRFVIPLLFASLSSPILLPKILHTFQIPLNTAVPSILQVIFSRQVYSFDFTIRTRCATQNRAAQILCMFLSLPLFFSGPRYFLFIFDRRIPTCPKLPCALHRQVEWHRLVCCLIFYVSLFAF